jgi:catechol 2,3-dioxygenase-like lactoylglutathione lyase family enzyme
VAAMAHHTAIRVRDVDASLRFWRDGLGFEVMMDQRFSGDWPTLLRAPSRSLRAVFLGRTEHPDAGIVELVDLGVVAPGPVGGADDRPPPPGLLLVSVMTDVSAALDRLSELGLGGEPRRIEVHGIDMCTVVDPDGVVVELVHADAAANLEQLGPP